MKWQLTGKDIFDGKELYELIEKLPEDEKKQALIYVRALCDRQIMTNDKKAG